MNLWPKCAQRVPNWVGEWVRRKQWCTCGHFIAQISSARAVPQFVCVIGVFEVQMHSGVNLTFMRSWFCLVLGWCFLFFFNKFYGQLQLEMNFWTFHKEVKEHHVTAASNTGVSFLCHEVNTYCFSFLLFLVTHTPTHTHPCCFNETLQ